MNSQKLTPQAEQQIIDRCQQGQTHDFAQLYDSYFTAIYRFIYYKTMHQQTAEDLTSQTFLKALDKIKSFNEQQGSFSSWLYQIARHNVIDHYRKQATATTASLETIWDVDDRSDLSQEVDDRLALNKVKKYLQNLNSQQRQILIMRLWDNLDYQQISELTGQTPANCRQLVCRGLQKIQENVMMTVGLIIIISSFLWNKL